MKKNSQSQFHLILPKIGDQEYHFCLKTAEEFTKAAQALFDRQRTISTPPLETVDEAKTYLLDNYREHSDVSSALDFGSPTVWVNGRQKYNGATLREHMSSRGLLEQFGLD